MSSWAVLIKCPGRWRAARGRKALARAYHPASIKEGKAEGQQPALVNLTMLIKHLLTFSRLDSGILSPSKRR
jgi:hypothetical protein